MSKIIGNNKTTFRVSVFIMTLLIISCSTNSSVVLQDDSCKAPCWRNIEIGKTELEHTVELLNQMSDIEPNSIRQGKNPQTGVEVVAAGFLQDDSNLEIRFLNGKAVSIYFTFEKNISLGDANKLFGEPKYIFLSAIKGDPFAYLTAEFLYPDLGICLLHEDKGIIVKIPKTYRISKATNITRVYYVDPALRKGQIDFGCFTGSNENDLNSEKQDWNGYEKYNVLDWSEVWSQN